jgi:hypothetical protein
MIEQGVLSTVPVEIGDAEERSAMLRVAVEEGKLFLVPSNKDEAPFQTYLAGVPGFAFLLALQKLSIADDNEPLSAAAKLIFGRLSELDFATLFERLVDMTLVSRSHSGNKSMHTFGVDLFANRVKKLTVRRERDGDVHVCNSNELFIPVDYQPGFDSRVTIQPNSEGNIADEDGLLKGADDTIFVYIQDKLARSSNKERTVVRTYAKMYTNVLVEHKKLLKESVKSDDAKMKAALEHVYIVMYDWGNDGKEFNTPTLEEVQEELKILCEETTDKIAFGGKKEALGKRDEANYKFAVAKFSEHFDSHVRTMGRREIEKWLIPSLLCFPRLILKVKGEE